MSGFEAAPGLFPLLGEHEAHVWKIVLDLDRADDRALLSDDERARADRFRTERDRNRFTTARAAMRRILAGYVEANPSTIGFRYEARGKPHMTAISPLQFNLSHSAGLGLLAVARTARVGVDVERIRFLDDVEALAKRHLSRRELSVWQALPESGRLAAFHRLWTQKEAFVKATGEGLALPLRDFEVLVRPAGPARVRDLRSGADVPGEWTFIGFEPGPGFAATLAVAAGDASVRFFSTGASAPFDAPAVPGPQAGMRSPRRAEALFA